MAADDAAEVPPRRQSRQAGYPGKSKFGLADKQLRRALLRLAREHLDLEARLEGASLVQEPTKALHALATRAEQASTAYKRRQADIERLRRRVDRRLAEAERRHGRACRPTPPEGHGNPRFGPHAASSYSWMSPPRTSRLRTRRGVQTRAGGSDGASGARRSSPRCGRSAL
jgi:hypothetical protein